MKHTPHDTRYTTATILDNAGANRVCIKKIMGHSTKDVTDGVYIQKDLSELANAIELIKI
jgi:integrase